MSYTYVNKKDLIRINQEIGENGNFHNENTLDFALSLIKAKKSWLYELSYLVRSLLVDHVFEDGNKRTAMILTATYLKDKNIEYDKDRLIRLFWNISKKNITDINKIMRLIKSVIIY
ncbi:Fic family protein [Candidatus Woesearchaeota archaeon]|nr:Fic family protein [Candidatus Woesearchaeota archaeon]